MTLLMYIQSQIQVPNIVGMTQANAETTITNAGLTVGSVTDEAIDIVASQDPIAGTSVEPGSAVDFALTQISLPFTETFDSLDTDLWSLDANATTYMSINSGKLRWGSDVGSDTIGTAYFDYLLTGDFDIRLIIDHVGYQTPSSSLHYAMLRAIEANYVMVGHTRGTEGRWMRTVANGSHESLYADSTDPITVRIIRTGSTLKVYEWDGGQWKWNGSTAGRTISTFTSSAPFRPAIWTKQEATFSWTIDYDNFTIQSAGGLTYSPV